MYSTAATTVSNILMDLLVVKMRGGMFMMGLTTSLSYYIGLIVLMPYYARKKDMLLRPALRRPSFK